MMETAKPIYSKTLRLLSMFERLAKGEVISKAVEAKSFGVDEKSIQRDIDDLRNFYQEFWGADNALPFYRKERGYRLEQKFQNSLTAPEILIIGKIMLESRSLKAEDMAAILTKLGGVCEPTQRKYLQKVLDNEMFHYCPVRQGNELINRIWALCQAVQERRLVKLSYCKERQSQLIQRTVEPCGIIFSEYYFYLVANIAEKDYPFPAVYRIDRISAFEMLETRFNFPYAKRFEEGKFRKRVQFMKPGQLMTIRFRFWGDSPEAALDRFPNAKVIRKTNQDVVIEAEVFGEGVVMWLLSQAEWLEVLEPKSLRETMKQTIEKMRQVYSPG